MFCFSPPKLFPAVVVAGVEEVDTAHLSEQEDSQVKRLELRFWQLVPDCSLDMRQSHYRVLPVPR
jgi:hypothetical protein